MISVVIPNYNGEMLLPQCIESLKEQDYKDTEITVVDDGSIDNSIETAKQYDVKVVELEGNYGFGATINRGVAESKGKYIFIASNDMRFEPNCISELLKVIESDSSIFAVDPKQYNWQEDKVIHSGITISKGSIVSSWFPFLKIEDTINDYQREEVWGCAGCLLIRRDMFDALGGFDETFFLDLEDTDICIRAWMHGWKTVYIPTAKLYHLVGGSGSLKSEHRILSGEQNFIRFVLKTMSKQMVFVLLGGKLLQGIGCLLVGKFVRAKAIFKAFMANMGMLRVTLRERDKILKSSKIRGDEILKRFIE